MVADPHQSSSTSRQNPTICNTSPNIALTLVPTKGLKCFRVMDVQTKYENLSKGHHLSSNHPGVFQKKVWNTINYLNK